MRTAGAEIVAVAARPVRVAMREPFAIAGGSSAELETVFTRVKLVDGSIGHGEASPFPAFNGETSSKSLRQILRAGKKWLGRDAASWRTRLEELENDLPQNGGAARAALGMALLDAWTRRAGMPLRTLFGGACDRVVSDVTVTLGDEAAAFAAARRIRALGVRIVKIKIGYGPR